MSSQGIPQIAIVMGSCTAGGAYVAGHVGREHHRSESRHDLSRRAAAGEGCDGARVVTAEETRRRRRAFPAIRRHRSLCAE